MPDELDAVDRALLDLIQADFPIAPEPYAILAQKTGISADEAYERIRKMRKSGFVRRLGANFQSSRLGFVSTLCAASVPEKRKDAFVALINAQPGVTHNYERKHHFNIWFTLISPSREKARETLEKLEHETDLEIMDLPATRLYKIRVDFPMR